MTALRAAPALLLAAWLPVGCAPAGAPPPVAAAATNLCRVGPDGGPPLLASDDRGIGGTGMLADGEDRGIGGTGIVGVVTGFASICLDGLRVGYAPGLPVATPDGMAGPEALRVGQVVVIAATERDGRLQARSLTLRHEVAGPVQAVAPGSLRVAGQRVRLGTGLPAGSADWGLGDAVAVSGLRAPDGSITATRIDRLPPGTTAIVHGTLTRQPDGTARIDGLALRPTAALAGVAAGPVVASGQLVGGALVPASIRPDLLARDPAAWFGPGVDRFVIETYTGVGGGRVSLGHGISALAPPGAVPSPIRRGIVELRQESGRGLVATGLRGMGGTDAPRGAPAFGPGAGRGDLAPMPDRRFEARQARDRPPQGGAPPAGAGGPPGPDSRAPPAGPPGSPPPGAPMRPR
ncbi:DUF5666 domain-containing protein [Humitalea sp. 24SJ18S-53]|uniref:DUF5666 domain-containing protein n=1 Tax=Humitalea sp. 24SJ18S-53 TaxID=3422307 RepID=UPI003D676CBE